MSHQNIEIVRRLYEAMNARDSEAVAELAHRDAEWIPDSRVGEKPIRGREKVIRFFSDRSEGSTEYTGDIFLPCANWKARGSDTNPT